MKSTTATNLLLILLGLVTIFHLVIMLKIIPYEITWGGRLENDQQMYAFESLSIFFNLYLILILLQKAKYINPVFPDKMVQISLWAFMILFALNTVGNLIAETSFEKSFAIITLVSSLLIWRIIKKPRRQISNE